MTPAHPTPWQPLTDEEWHAIRPFLPPHGGRGRPSDKRKTLDAIFWIAASRQPWKALPSHLGNGESVARTLRRWARAGWVDRLLMAVSDHPLAGGCAVLRRMRWLICRTFRRMARILGEPSLHLARNLGLRDAWPAVPLRLPEWDLSEINNRRIQRLSRALLVAPREALPPLIGTLKALHRTGEWLLGNVRQWRLR